MFITALQQSDSVIHIYTFFFIFFSIMVYHTCMLSHFSCVQLFVTQWTAAHEVPLSMGFSKQEYWSGLPCPSPGPGQFCQGILLLRGQSHQSPFTEDSEWDGACGPLFKARGLVSAHHVCVCVCSCTCVCTRRSVAMCEVH